MKLALFDLDHTLIKGDSASLWASYMYKLNWIDRSLLELNNIFMQEYDRGNMSMQQYQHLFNPPLAANNRTCDDIAKIINNFILEQIRPIIYPDGKALVKKYLDRDYRVILISATGEHIVKPIAKEIGINEVIAIELETQDNKYTGNTKGILSYREGKVARLKQYLEHQYEQAIPNAYFYSDSHNDLPLMQEVGYPVATNPNAILKQYAIDHDFSILNWKL